MPKEYFRGDAEDVRSYSPAVKATGGATIYLAGRASRWRAISRGRCGPPSNAFERP